MKKKITHVLFAFILTIATLVPMFPQSVAAQTAGDRTFAAQQFNRRLIAFNHILARAQASMSEARILALVSVSLGISADVIVGNFTNLALPRQMSLNDFIVVLIISRSTTLPADQIVDACDNNLTFGQVITNLGITVNTVDFRSLLFRINGFMADLEAAISLQLGQIEVDTEQFLRNFELTMQLFTERFGRFSTNFVNFRPVFVEVLGGETGFDTITLENLRQQFPNLTDAEFAMLTLTISSLRGNNVPDGAADFIVGGIPMDNLDADVIFKLFEQRGLPVFMLGSRLDAFSRRLNLVLRQNNPATPVIGF